MNINSIIEDILEKIEINKPLVHHITNYVTVNDCANVVLAIGGSPVMADDPKEVEEMVSIASSLVLNVGTLNERTIDSFLLAGKRANVLGIPVLLDPVGVGATDLRSKTVERILNEINISVLRGNMSEIKNIYGIESLTRGVDSIDSSLEGGEEIAYSLADKLNCTVAITGEVDIISNGKKIFTIHNGHKMLSKITGTGCMSSSLIGVCCGTSIENIYGVITGLAVMGISGEKAFYNLKPQDGLGSFKVKLMDAISTFTIDDIKERGKIYEIK